MNIKKIFELIPKDVETYYIAKIEKAGDSLVIRNTSDNVIVLDKSQLEALKFLLNTEF